MQRRLLKNPLKYVVNWDRLIIILHAILDEQYANWKMMLFFVESVKVSTLLSVLCLVCLEFLPLVSLFGLFPVLAKCDYWSIFVQLVSLSMIFLCIYSLDCSVWIRPVYSLLPGVPVCVYLALLCLESLKTVYLSYILVCVYHDPPSFVHHDNCNGSKYTNLHCDASYLVFFRFFIHYSCAL